TIGPLPGGPLCPGESMDDGARSLTRYQIQGTGRRRTIGRTPGVVADREALRPVPLGRYRVAIEVTHHRGAIRRTARTVRRILLREPVHEPRVSVQLLGRVVVIVRAGDDLLVSHTERIRAPVGVEPAGQADRLIGIEVVQSNVDPLGK